jgi:hypothetical protein
MAMPEWLRKKYEASGLRKQHSLWLKNQVAVDDFVAARAPSFSKIQQSSTKRRKRFILNQLETTEFNKFQ